MLRIRNKTRRATWSVRGILLVLSVGVGTVSCRTVDGERSSDLAEVGERRWYGPDGVAAECGVADGACAAPSVDSQPFVEACVAGGYQAKLCGCVMLCTGRIGVQTAPAPVASEAAGAAAAGPVSPVQPGPAAPPTCGADDQEVIAKAARSRRAGTAQDRCLEAAVCRGNFQGCEPVDLALARQLRASAARACEATLLEQICPDGYDDTLACREADVALLTEVAAELRDRGSEARRCLRGAVCADNAAGCSPAQLRRAEKAKAALERDGCEYWLRSICAVGSH